MKLPRNKNRKPYRDNSKPERRARAHFMCRYGIVVVRMRDFNAYGKAVSDALWKLGEQFHVFRGSLRRAFGPIVPWSEGGHVRPNYESNVTVREAITGTQK